MWKKESLNIIIIIITIIIIIIIKRKRNRKKERRKQRRRRREEGGGQKRLFEWNEREKNRKNGVGKTKLLPIIPIGHCNFIFLILHSLKLAGTSPC